MRPSQRRKWRDDDEPSPRERREMMERGEWIDGDEVPNRAPLVFRILAWTSLVIIFFAVGYGATSLAFKWLDSRAYNRGAARTPSNLSGSPEETQNILTRTPQTQDAVVQNAATDSQNTPGEGDIIATISIPDGNTFKTRQIRCTNALQEDRIKQVLSAYMDTMKESQMLGAGVQDLNIFQSGDWLYLNMNGAFLESIKTFGADKSRVMLTGLVKTITDNFPPINKIKFYVDGKEVSDKNPLDLTAPWGISTRPS
ncbi:MAG: GerMN domain-containing protein [Synergistaceae bacterium]|nr:GerMN domain-containing protein [Synergistaceae bacterium]